MELSFIWWTMLVMAKAAVVAANEVRSKARGSSTVWKRISSAKNLYIEAKMGDAKGSWEWLKEKKWKKRKAEFKSFRNHVRCLHVRRDESGNGTTAEHRTEESNRNWPNQIYSLAEFRRIDNQRTFDRFHMQIDRILFHSFWIKWHTRLSSHARKLKMLSN